VNETKTAVKQRVLWWLNDAAFKAPEQLTEHYYECMAEDIACLAVGEESDAAAIRLDPPRHVDS
jgi:hypothetical protein